jgi:hypothetical protein
MVSWLMTLIRGEGRGWSFKMSRSEGGVFFSHAGCILLLSWTASEMLSARAPRATVERACSPSAPVIFIELFFVFIHEFVPKVAKFKLVNTGSALLENYSHYAFILELILQVRGHGVLVK